MRAAHYLQHRKPQAALAAQHAAGFARLLAPQSQQGQQQRDCHGNRKEPHEIFKLVIAKVRAGANAGCDDAEHQHRPHQAGGLAAAGRTGAFGNQRQIGRARHKGGDALAQKVEER